MKQLIESKKELNKTVDWKKYISKFDIMVPKLKDAKLVELNEKLSEMNDKILKITESSNSYNKYKFIINYYEAKIGMEINKRVGIEKEIIE